MLFEKQEYQETCVDNIVSILGKMDNFFDNDFSDLPDALKNHYDEQGYQDTIFPIKSRNGMDVLMETGTGKTFCYLKTIFELNKHFNKTRFVVIVPRTSIRAGIRQSITQTEEYFQTQYGKKLSVIEIKDAKKDIPHIENQFLHEDTSIQVLLLTSSTFNNVNNTMNKRGEKILHIQGSMWDNVVNVNPIVIMDEPHMLTGDKTLEALKKLDKSLVIRFGATYPTDTKKPETHISNVAYVLDSISAFNHFLVKRIRVNTTWTADTHQNYKVSSILSNKKQCSISYFSQGEVKTDTLIVKQDMGAVTGIPALGGVTINKMTAKTVYLSNGETLELGEGFKIGEDETRIMIQQTIKKHFEKEQCLFTQGIKTLSLFFIPSIDGFRGNTPHIKTIFEQEYRQIRDDIYKATNNPEYKKYLDGDYTSDNTLFVHQGYFAGDKGTTEEKERIGVSEILNDKTALLSLGGKMSNLRFIFSVWALQEGWDNPNIMNICKLTHTTKDISRRQQVGRGLRIAVNQSGQRLTHKYLNDNERGTQFYKINTLDMIVSHHELDFIDRIQHEITESSFGIMGDIITMEYLKSIGLSELSLSRFIIVCEDNGILKQNADGALEIKSPIIEFIKNNKNTDTFSKFSVQDIENLENAFEQSSHARVTDGNKQPPKVAIRPNKYKEFQVLWETIHRKSKIVYQDLNEQDLIDTVIKNFKDETIPPLVPHIIEKEYDTHTNTVELKSDTIIAHDIDYEKHFNVYDFIQSVVDGANVPKCFVRKIYTSLCDNALMDTIIKNPKMVKRILIDSIRDTIHTNIIQSVSYNFESQTTITNTKLHENGVYKTEIDPSALGHYISDKQPLDALLYDTVVYDSKIEEDAQAQDAPNDKVTVFAKLPSISIPTPYKAYNPDFAYLVEKPDGKQVFLVVETKGYDTENDIPDDEKQKIKYGERFFDALQREIPDIDIQFKTRINTTDFTQILHDVMKG